MSKKPAKSKSHAASPDLRGYVVQDKVTRFKGVVTGVVWFLSGTIQANVDAGIDKDGKMRETFGFDIQRLTRLKMGPVKATLPDDTTHILLGNTASDKVTGTVGTLTEKCVYLNGCTHFILTTKAIKKEERVIAVDWKRLDLTGSTSVLSAPAGKPPKGGPHRRVERH